ncbi:MAG: hypothetical protein ABI306_01725 [Caulobacteraceae bacterium]
MLKYLLAIASLLFAVPQAGLAATASAAPPPTVNPPLYCTATGGSVQRRVPEYGTNGANPLVLAYPRDFCEYLSKDGSTHIDVLLTTLVTTRPTLAALAYYAKKKINLHQCQGGPGSCYCAQVGGTDSFGGVNLAGGGWVLSTNVNDVLDVCVFPDLSAIDAYGLFYHAYGIIRGQPLKGLLRFPDPY